MYDLDDMPDDCGYNKVYQYKYCLNAHGVPGGLIAEMIGICDHKFGWHFIPHANMDWSRENWYEDQTAYISFEDRADLVNVVLSSRTINL